LRHEVGQSDREQKMQSQKGRFPALFAFSGTGLPDARHAASRRGERAIS
jgi:hypothetical protein